MRRTWKAVRYSAVGLTIAGVFSAIAGCSTEDGIRAIILFLIMLLTGGGGEEATTGPPPVTEIVLYSAGQTGSGDLASLGIGADGREGADKLCIAAKPATVTNPNVRAFISVTASDDIEDMPTNYGVPTSLPIVSVTGNTVASEWSDLFDHAVTLLPDTLDNLGITDSSDGGDGWWSGSLDTGAVEVNETCTQWMSTANSGRKGSTTQTGSGWISNTRPNCNDIFNELLCLGF